MKKIITIFAIFAIIAVSGCLGGDGDEIIIAQGHGLEMTNFTSNVYSLYSDQTTHVTLVANNQGGNIVDSTYGLALLIIPGDWVVTPANAQAYKKDLTFASSSGAPAGSQYFTWNIKAPPLASGQQRTDSITGRLYYDYQTTLTGTLWVYPESEAMSEREQGNPLNTLTYETTRGPIEISVSVVPDPVSVYSPPEIFTMTIEFTNVGGGTVYKDKTVTSSSYSISDANRNVISATAAVTGLTLVDSTCLDHVEFFGNKATAICDVEITAAQAPSSKQSYPIKVTADYGYYTDKIIQLTVSGR